MTGTKPTPGVTRADSDDTIKLTSRIVTMLYEVFWDHSRGEFRFAGETFRLLDDGEYRALGEDPAADDVPLILMRESDGQCFEVVLDATAWPTSREDRDAARERDAVLVKMLRERLSAAAGENPGEGQERTEGSEGRHA